MRTSEGRRGFDWSQIVATVIGGVIAIGAGVSADYWKAHMEAQATGRAQSRLVRGSERAWRDDLYEAEELIGLAIKNRRWTAERFSPLANIQDYKEVSRAASWGTWRDVSTAQDALDHVYRIWSQPRPLTAADVTLLSKVLISAERARLELARELDTGKPSPAQHPIFREAGLQYLLR